MLSLYYTHILSTQSFHTTQNNSYSTRCKTLVVDIYTFTVNSILTGFCFKTSHSIPVFKSIKFNAVLLVQLKHVLRERVSSRERVHRDVQHIAVARTSLSSV